jgi:hypothetical protein
VKKKGFPTGLVEKTWGEIAGLPASVVVVGFAMPG